VVQKKVSKLGLKLMEQSRDYFISELFKHFKISNGLILYNIVTSNPIDIVIAILSIKLGLSKTVIILIVAFLL
jgi:hypothetical protein